MLTSKLQNSPSDRLRSKAPAIYFIVLVDVSPLINTPWSYMYTKAMKLVYNFMKVTMFSGKFSF